MIAEEPEQDLYFEDKVLYSIDPKTALAVVFF